MDPRTPLPINGQHHPVSRQDRAARSPFMDAVQAEIDGEDDRPARRSDVIVIVLQVLVFCAVTAFVALLAAAGMVLAGITF